MYVKFKALFIRYLLYLRATNFFRGRLHGAERCPLNLPLQLHARWSQVFKIGAEKGNKLAHIDEPSTPSSQLRFNNGFF